MTSDCEGCSESRKRGYNFCLWCGHALHAPAEDKRPKRAVFICGICIMIICAIILIVEISIAFYKAPYVFDSLSGQSNGMLIITPIPVTMFHISGVVLQTYYVMLLVSVLVSVALLIYKAAGPMGRLVREKDKEPIKGTALFEMSVLFAATYLIQMAFIIVLVMLGTDVETPLISDSGEMWEDIFLLLQASVWEEVISRVLLIGVPMLVIALLLRYKNVVSELDPETKPWRYLVGGFGMSRVAVVFIFFSAIMFGAAHVPGWDLWKFFPTFMAGLVLGYLFVKYGLYASIGLHFLTDYLSSLDWVITDGSLIILIPLLLLAILGIPYAVIYIKKGFAYMRENFLPSKYNDESTGKADP